MAVANDTATSAVAWQAGAPNPYTFTHTPSGTPRGVLVFLFHNDQTDDLMGTVTYGGVAMTRIQRAHDDFGEHGAAYVYFLGSDIPTGAQTVSITYTSGGFWRKATCITFTASYDTQIAASAILQDTSAADIPDPQITLDTGTDSSLRYCGIWTGHDDPANLTPLGSMSTVDSYSFGTDSIRVDRQTSPASGSIAIGYTGVGDDCAMVAVAVKEAAPGTNYSQTISDGLAVADSSSLKKVFLKAISDSVGLGDSVSEVHDTTPFTVPINQWVQQGPPSLVGVSEVGATYEGRGWNHLRFNPNSGKFVLYDGYLSPTRLSTIYANAIWLYDPIVNTLTMDKLSNWQRIGGVTTPTSANATDPTPWDRHSYSCIVVAPARNKIYMWGGANTSISDGVFGNDGNTGDTWVYDFPSRTWREISHHLPWDSFEQSFSYDPFTDKVILFGARMDREQDPRDTLIFDPTTELWSVVTPSPTPSQRFGHCMVFDPVRRVTWMFGGGYTSAFDELWKYDALANTWVQIPKSGAWPAARRFTHMAYDTVHNLILLWGGTSFADVMFNDTWVFDPAAQTWTQLSPSSSPTLPPNNFYSEDMDYDPVNNVFVLNVFGTFYLYRLAEVKGTTISENISVATSITKSVGRKLLDSVHPVDLTVGPPPQVSIPLTTREVLYAGVTSLARSNAPVTAGIPLRREDNIRSVNELGMTGSSAAQFRVLSRYSNGNLKFVLVDYLASVSASGVVGQGGTAAGVTLVTGTGNFGGVDLAQDLGAILVDTGAMSVSISKTPFRLFDQIAIGATGMLQPGVSEGVTVVSGGVRYSSIYDTNAVTTIEENGPVRCCIKSNGALKSSAGVRLMDYTVRMHFYKGRAQVRAFVSLRNAGPSLQAPLFDSSEVNVKLSLGSGVQYTTKTSLGTYAQSLAAGESAYLYQAYSTQLGWSENTYPLAPMANDGAGNFTQRGVEVKKVGTSGPLALTGNTADYAEGWMDVGDATGKGVTMGLRWMSAFWPSGIEVAQDGTASIQLFSKRNNKTNIKFAWGAHETRELFFDFHTAPPSNILAPMYDMTYPLSSTAALAQYNDAGAVYGEKHLVTEANQQAWFSAHSANSGPSLANFTPAFWRWHNWPTGGGGNQTDFALIDLVDWIRTGRGAFLIQGIRNSIYKADTAIRRSDGFLYYENQLVPGDEGTGVNAGAFNARVIDFEHAHWQSLPLAYLLTGNEQFREAAVDFGEWRLGMADGIAPVFYLPLQIFDDGGMRGWSRYLRDFAQIYEFTGDNAYYGPFLTMVDMLLASRDTQGVAGPPPTAGAPGRNIDRGYMFMFHDNYLWPGKISDFITVQIHFETAYEAWRILKELGDIRASALEDYLLGLADFIYNEMYFEVGSSVGQLGYLYQYYLDVANTLASNPHYLGNSSETFRPISSARAMAFAYALTGDGKYMTRQQKLLPHDIQYVTTRTPSDYPSQAGIWYDLNRPVTEAWFDLAPLTVVNNGNGTYDLSWTVPANTTAIQIRSAEAKTIKPWLGFDQLTRVFQFLPTVNVPWYAATRYPNNPAPGTSGTTQHATVTGFDPVKQYGFAVRYQTAGAQAGTFISKILTESLGVLTPVQMSESRTLIEAIGTNDTVLKLTSLPLAESVGLADTVTGTKVTLKVISDTLSMADSVVRRTGVVLVESISVLSTTIKGAVRKLTDSTALADAVTGAKGYAKTLVENLTIVDATQKLTQRVLSDTFALIDTIGRLYQKVMAEVVGVTDSANRGVGRTLVDAVAIADANITEAGSIPPQAITTEHKRIRVSHKDRVKTQGGG